MERPPPKARTPYKILGAYDNSGDGITLRVTGQEVERLLRTDSGLIPKELAPRTDAVDYARSCSWERFTGAGMQRDGTVRNEFVIAHCDEH